MQCVLLCYQTGAAPDFALLFRVRRSKIARRIPAFAELGFGNPSCFDVSLRWKFIGLYITTICNPQELLCFGNNPSILAKTILIKTRSSSRKRRSITFVLHLSSASYEGHKTNPLRSHASKNNAVIFRRVI